ncbi:hypothetical protein AXG93_2573s1040 [Marchantia polymorpha subsp. ruderalis]|uniref:Uncharacterized protein n=1 Tax=Marchantia polymorpha subsp. ruderalis TaxID=1480154 RepID=A0A176WIG6_MARPO|nr:hypothetical protein AXG93_2573s1040 [Marchantia polymorpha subsp. ruderalis]
MGLLTREEEKQFPRERKILTAESSEGTEDDNRQPSISPQTTARGGFKWTFCQIGRGQNGDWQREEKCVEKTGAPIVSTSEVVVGESTQPMEIKEPSGVLTEVPAYVIRRERTWKREKYVVSKEVGFYVEMVRNSTQLKRVEAVKREWDSTTEMAWERAAILSVECTAAKAALKEREAQLREKEIECEMLQLNLAKESGRSVELEETCGGLCVSKEWAEDDSGFAHEVGEIQRSYDEAVKRSERLITTAEKREKKHVKELAKLETRRAEEVRIAEELRGKIPEAKTAEEDIRNKISEIAGKCEMEFRRAEELSASLAEGVQKHEEELANWAKKLADCESAKSSEVECKLKTVKWLKLDSLERRLMSTKTSGSAGHKQIVELVNSFSEGLNEARQNVEVEIVNVLCRIGEDVSYDDIITAT